MLGFPRPLVFAEPPPYVDGTGAEYARTLAEKGQRHSFRLIVIGWVFIIAAGICALLGTTARTQFEVEEKDGDVIALKSGAGHWLHANIGTVFGVCAIVFAGIGWQSLDRATAAALLASAATTALSFLPAAVDETADIKVYKMCLEAKSGWLEGRMNHDRRNTIAQSFFGEGNTQPTSRNPKPIPNDADEQ
ncbi:hypothetical protein Pla52nx_003447 [Stieleria varia]|uniref:hypothetical protein n=1 Tax=Stieleria varia TaxID=2528005 RepID=UPI00313AC074